MNVAGLLKQLNQKRNRIISWAARAYRRWTLRGKILVVRGLAWVLNRIPGQAAAASEEMLPASGTDSYLTLHCMGAVDVTGGNTWSPELDSYADCVRNGALSFAIAVNQKDAGADPACKALLRNKGITLLWEEKCVSSRMYRASLGNLAVITYDRAYKKGPDYGDKIRIMQHILALKRSGADYILVYINNRPGDYAEKNNSSRLCKVLAQMGVDYVIGITPDRRDSGSTYLKPDGTVARSIYSLGAFLHNGEEVSSKRIVLRLKLGKVRDKLQLVQETYLPYYRMDQDTMVPLIGENGLTPEQTKKYRSEIADEMPRIRPADRVLTVGKVMELIGTELPETYQHLKDFSVGQICARSFEVKPGDVFFFREPFNDPNDLEYVSPQRRLRIAKNAVKKGAMLLVTFQSLPFSCASVLCDNVMEAHIAVCAHLRRQYDMKTIAITGSVGKTSTKDMLAEVMRMGYQTVKSERNSNVQVAIGMNLQKLNDTCQVFIQEVGGGRPGGASRHSRMVLPEVTVVTNIGDAHIGNFGSREKLMENKLQIVEGMAEGGTLYLNGDDPLLAQVHPDCKTVFYAVHNHNADYYAQNYSARGGYSTFEIVHGRNITPVTLRVLGEYNVLNAVCCFAIGKQFGIPEADIVEGLSRFQTAGIRQNLMEVCGRKLFLDCYNASTESVKSAMEILTQIQIEPGKKRIAVVGDITGMGALAEEIHREIADTIRRYPVDHVLLFGEDVRFTYDVLKETDMDVRWFTKREELNNTIGRLVGVGDVAMFKGSSKMLLEYSVDVVFGTRLTDQRLRDEREYKYARRGAIVYDLFANHATAEVFDPLRGGLRRVQIAGSVGGIEVVNMGRALQGSKIAQVTMPDSVRHISAEAFLECSQLTDVRMPKKLKYIGIGAFRNCRSLREVKLPDQVLHIGARAFYGCSGLRKITIPASVVQIGADAFAGCENARFVVEKGSYAERYLQEAGLSGQMVTDK